MNEVIRVRFTTPSGRPLRVRWQSAHGIVFDEPDPIERSVGLQLVPRGAPTRERLRWIGRTKGWAPGELRLSVGVEDGGLTLRGEDPDSLPEGLYALRVEVEEAHARQAATSLALAHHGSAKMEVTLFPDVRDVVVDLDGCDDEIRRVLEASTLDGRPGPAWVASPDRRATRRACLLNLLASLRVTPRAGAVLIGDVREVLTVMNDRVYARVDRDLLGRLDGLATSPTAPVYREGRPRARIHDRLLEGRPDKTDFGDLVSFRAEGAPSLQVVVATPVAPVASTYAEFDLDMGNPLQDVLGFLVHMGELLDGKPTNHLDVGKRLRRTKAGRYLPYALAAG
jgi:hypothetical protein